MPAAGPVSHSAQSLLPLSSPPRRAAVCITPAASVCVCVLGGSLGTRGSLSHLPRRRRRHCLWLPIPGGDSGANGEAPREGTGRAGRPRPPTSRGRGCRSRLLLFVVWGSAPPPLSLLAPGVSDWGVGMRQRRPPLASHGNLGGGDTAPPPPAGLGELRGPLGADSPLYLARSLPQTHTSAPRPARVWQGVESTQVRGSGFPTTVRAPSRS